MSSTVIFLFAKKLNNVSYKIKGKIGKTDSESTEEESNGWYEKACSDKPNGTECESCKQCSSRSKAACDACLEFPRLCNYCECNPFNPEKFLCLGLYKPAFQRLRGFLGEPAEDSPCNDYLFPKKEMCQVYEMTNSWHCNTTDSKFPEKANCIAGVIEKGATKRYIVAGLLIVSMLGHLVHLGVTIWCSGDESANPDRNYEYKVQEDENNKDDQDGGGEKEEHA